MPFPDPQQLSELGFLSEESLHRIQTKESEGAFSLHWELRTLLYIGVLMLTTGLGILIYQNIDTIGHQAILAFIALACLGCFLYCFKQSLPFSPTKVEQASPFFDYVLLLGALLFLTFEGYIQFQYQVFGERYGLLAILPSLLFLFLAYRFDNVGILSMGITGIAAWLGINLTPAHRLESFNFSENHLIVSGISLGIVLTVIGWALVHRGIKAHFFFTYINFASHLLFVSTLSGLFLANGAETLIWFMGLALLVIANFFHAKKEKSFYFLLIAIVYGYIGLTYVFTQWLDGTHGEAIIWLGLWYFIASCASIIWFLINHKKILANLWKTDAAETTGHSNLQA